MEPRRTFCRLCDALTNPIYDGHFRPCNTILYKTSHFAVIPTIGPLVRGHVLIVSKAHTLSLATIADENGGPGSNATGERLIVRVA